MKVLHPELKRHCFPFDHAWLEVFQLLAERDFTFGDWQVDLMPLGGSSDRQLVKAISSRGGRWRITVGRTLTQTLPSPLWPNALIGVIATRTERYEVFGSGGLRYVVLSDPTINTRSFWDNWQELTRAPGVLKAVSYVGALSDEQLPTSDRLWADLRDGQLLPARHERWLDAQLLLEAATSWLERELLKPLQQAAA